MNLAQLVLYCAENDELVANFNRLTKSNFLVAEKRSPLDKMIDDACGYDPQMKEDDLKKFIAFVIECVWTRLPDDAFETEERLRIKTAPNLE